VEKLELKSDMRNGLQTVHIFMTDGQITAGERNGKTLLEKVTNINCTNIFIGFGNDHSDKLLRTLSSSPKGEYYFIESLENAGMVYGEVVYNGLYEYMENIKISINNGEIYDYKTNTWSGNLYLDSVASGQDRTWHVRNLYTNEDVVGVEISYNTDRDKHVEYCSALYPEDGQDIDVHIKKYQWRQRTQELMYEVSELINNKDTSSLSHTHPPRPPALFRSRNIEENYAIVDAAIEKRWDIVWKMLGTNPALMNRRPLNMMYCVIHIAALQGNEEAITCLFNRGAIASVLTEDGRTAMDVARENNRDAIVELLSKRMEEYPGVGNYNIISSRVLNQHMSSMKTYMIEEGLCEDLFMKNLCDDIYVAIRSLDSNLGMMYLGARATSQGTQRAYNLTDISNMETNDIFPIQPTLRHSMSQDPNSIYASPQATVMMRGLSATVTATSCDTQLEVWIPQTTLMMSDDEDEYGDGEYAQHTS
jgi:hypothetical protein